MATFRCCMFPKLSFQSVSFPAILACMFGLCCCLFGHHSICGLVYLMTWWMAENVSSKKKKFCLYPFIKISRSWLLIWTNFLEINCASLFPLPLWNKPYFVLIATGTTSFSQWHTSNSRKQTFEWNLAYYKVTCFLLTTLSHVTLLSVRPSLSPSSVPFYLSLSS